MWLQLHVYGMSVIRESDLKVVERAERTTNREASRKFGVDMSRAARPFFLNARQKKRVWQ